jgi:hypothetical protein
VIVQFAVPAHALGELSVSESGAAGNACRRAIEGGHGL